MKMYLFEQGTENDQKFVGHTDTEKMLSSHTLEEVEEILLSKFNKEKIKNREMVYPYMVLVSIATEMGLERDDEVVNLAWDKIT